MIILNKIPMPSDPIEKVCIRIQINAMVWLIMNLILAVSAQASPVRIHLYTNIADSLFALPQGDLMSRPGGGAVCCNSRLITTLCNSNSLVQHLIAVNGIWTRYEEAKKLGAPETRLDDELARAKLQIDQATSKTISAAKT